jgi:hypothetical protein
MTLNGAGQAARQMDRSTCGNTPVHPWTRDAPQTDPTGQGRRAGLLIKDAESTGYLSK